jgi:hypothetical protein
LFRFYASQIAYVNRAALEPKNARAVNYVCS